MLFVIWRKHSTFQYMLLLRGATRESRKKQSKTSFQYMLLLRGATGVPRPSSGSSCVSIHAPLARSNNDAGEGVLRYRRFNTCSSCEEQLHMLRTVFVFRCFNTCSSCEEQQNTRSSLKPGAGFNTCSSCEEQLQAHQTAHGCFPFQYMLLLRGATETGNLSVLQHPFQYMLLLRGATLSDVLH